MESVPLVLECIFTLVRAGSEDWVTTFCLSFIYNFIINTVSQFYVGKFSATSKPSGLKHEFIFPVTQTLHFRVNFKSLFIEFHSRPAALKYIFL